MLIPLTVQKDTSTGNGKIKVSIVYLTSQYQEVINIPDFGFDSMFSGIGGFVGIFLGYSFLQATELIKTVLFRKWWSSVFMSISKLCSFHTSWSNKGKNTYLINY